jgi:sugar lactone lactonase YvrE
MTFGRYLSIPFLVLAVAVPARGVDTSFWQIGSFDEFLQGTLTEVSVSKEGELTLAPDAQTVFSPEEALALSLARDGRGNIYVGTGHQGKVFRVSPDQKASLFFTAHEPDIFAMTVGPDGALYVGSSPEGKVYRVSADGQSSVFYDPRTKYIWALRFDAQGRLYVATGDKGQILRVDPSGKGEVFFDSKQTHIMCLELDPQGNLLAGSVPNGLIYRITPQGKAFVLYQASLPEVHDLAVDPQGNIFAATLGGAGGKGSPELLLAPPAGTPGGGGGVTTVTVTASTESEQARGKTQNPPTGSVPASFNRQGPVTAPRLPLQLPQGRGALVEIFPDSTAETVWSSNNESIFGLAVRNAHVLFSTDTHGRIFDLDPKRDGEKLTLLAETHESLTTRLLLGGSNLYAATSNAAKLFRIGALPTHEGTFEAPVKDTKFVSRWGVLAWRGDVPAGCTLEFYTRSGNSDRPDHTWSDWAGPYSNPSGDPIASPQARYIQWKAIFRASGGASPTLDDVSISYLNQNLPPEIRSLNVSTSGERTGPAGPGPAANVSLGTGLTVAAAPTVSFGVAAAAPSQGAKASVTLTWQAEDPNGDQLIYALYVRATDEQEWHLLKDKLHQTSHTIDPGALPDGKYVARLAASDEESNPPNLARTSELQSAPFWIDNTPPEVQVRKQTVTGSTAEVQFVAEDSTSPLRSAETCLDGKTWQDMVSDDGIVDSRRETFTVKLSHLEAGEHILALRAYDTAGNPGVGKAVIRIPAAGGQAH